MVKGVQHWRYLFTTRSEAAAWAKYRKIEKEVVQLGNGFWSITTDKEIVE
jgi:hypothetical protein